MPFSFLPRKLDYGTALAGMALTLTILPALAAPSIYQRASDKLRYDDCLKLAGQNPAAALGVANKWANDRGGPPSQHCTAVALVRLLGRKPVRWVPAFLIAMVGVASHLILDLTNVYGVRLLLPFSGHWTHWDLTPVIDLTIWLLLLIGVIAPALGRLVGSEIGERPRSTGGGWAFFALLLLTGYDYGRSVLHSQAVGLMDSRGMLDSRSYNGLSPRRVGAFP